MANDQIPMADPAGGNGHGPVGAVLVVGSATRRSLHTTLTRSRWTEMRMV